MSQRKSILAPMSSTSRFAFVGDARFVVQKPVIQTTSNLFKHDDIIDLPNERPAHFAAYLNWVEGKGIHHESDSNPAWWNMNAARVDDNDNDDGDHDDGDNDDVEGNDGIWLDLGDLWFFGSRIGAHEFQDAVIQKCMEKRRFNPTHLPLSDDTVDRFFSPRYPAKTPFHTFLVDTCFMTAIDEDEVAEYDNLLFQMACSARQVYLSEVISKMMIKKRKREQKKGEEGMAEEEKEDSVKMNVLSDYTVSPSSSYDDALKKPAATRRADDSSDEDERGSTRMRGSVKLDLIKRVLKYGTVD